MNRKHTPALTPNARALRKNMTPQEKKLWHQFLKTYSPRILRQKVVGQFIVDFYCSKAKLVIELDGSQHYTEDGLEYDKLRTELLEKYDLKVIRFSNSDVDNRFSAVCQRIDTEIQERVIP